MITELGRLGADRAERCDGKKRHLFKNYNQSLNKLTINDLLVFHFDVGVLVFCSSTGLHVYGLHDIPVALIPVF